jgi:hypothetical protein
LGLSQLQTVVVAIPDNQSFPIESGCETFSLQKNIRIAHVHAPLNTGASGINFEDLVSGYRQKPYDRRD